MGKYKDEVLCDVVDMGHVICYLINLDSMKQILLMEARLIFLCLVRMRLKVFTLSIGRIILKLLKCSERY